MPETPLKTEARAMASSKPVPVVPCPQCRQPSRFSPDNRWRPFCSERCRSLDLGAWASESYRVPASPPDPTESGRHDEPPEREH